MTTSGFWDLLAPHHAQVEDHYLDVRSIRAMVPEIRPPVLVVGAGQGLIVAELRRNGLECEGVDLSPEMIRYAQIRRNLSIRRADARALPFKEGTFPTLVYATGVIDFMGDEDAIKIILTEARRIVKPSGKIFVAFYRLSSALENFLTRTGLLRNNVLAQRKSLEMCMLNPGEMVAWVSKNAGIGHLPAIGLLLRMSMLSTLREKTISFRMQKILRQLDNPGTFIDAAPENQPYRNDAEIRNLFQRLGVPIKQVRAFSSCRIVEI